MRTKDTYSDNTNGFTVNNETFFVHGINCDHASGVCVHGRLAEAERSRKVKHMKKKSKGKKGC